MAPGPDRLERVEGVLLIDEEIGDQNHDPRTPDHLPRLHERRAHLRVAPRTGLRECSDDSSPVDRPRLRRNDGAQLFVVADEAYGVLLPQQEKADRGDDLLGVIDLAEPRRGATPVHRPADIEDNHRPHIGLLL